MLPLSLFCIGFFGYSQDKVAVVFSFFSRFLSLEFGFRVLIRKGTMIQQVVSCSLVLFFFHIVCFLVR